MPFVQEVHVDATGVLSSTISLPNPTVAGNTIVAAIRVSIGGPQVVNCSGNNGETYAVTTAIDDTVGDTFAMAYAQNIAGRSGHQLTTSNGSSTNFRWGASEYDDVEAASFDQVSTPIQGSGFPVVLNPTGTTTQAKETIVYGLECGTGASAYVPSDGSTIRWEVIAGGPDYKTCMMDREVNAIAAYTHTGDFTVGAGPVWAGIAVTLKRKLAVAVAGYAPLMAVTMRPGRTGIRNIVAMTMRVRKPLAMFGGGSQTFFLTFNATLAPTANTTRSTSLSRGGTLTPSAVAVRLTSLLRGGTLTPSANPVRLTTLPRGGTLAPSGTLARFTSLFRGGSLTPIGTAPRQTQKPAAANLTPSANVVRQAQKPAGGALAPTGTISKAVSRKFLAAIQPLGTIVKAVTKGAFTCTLGISGAVQLLRVILMTITANLTPTATLGRLTLLFRGGTIAPTGSASRATSRTLRGTLAPSGTTLRLTAKGFTAVLAMSGSIRKAVGKFLTAVLNFIGLLTNDSTVVELHLVKMEVSPIILTNTASVLDTTAKASFIDLRDTATPILPDNTGKPYV